MNKKLKKIIAGTFIAFCLGGVATSTMPIVDAYASNLNYHTNYDQLRVQSVYSEGDNMIVLVNVSKSLFESGGVSVECRPATGGWIEYWSGKSYPVKIFDDGTKSSYTYNYDTQKYEVKFEIKKSAIGNTSRAYVYNYVGDGTGVVMDENGGYGYQIW